MVFNWVYAKFTIPTILLTFCGINETTAQGCKFTLTQDSGTFQSPDFPGKYPNDMECIWNIQVQPGSFVLLSFDVFELESYRGKCIDLVEVKDGSRSTDQLLGSFCDISLPPKVITSSSNSLRIWFYSDKSDAYQGFNASYTSQWEKGCGGSLSKHSESVSSPRYPDYPYPNSMQCDWTIIMPRGKFIRLEFSHFEMEFNCDGKCRCADHLELWDGPEFNETKLGSFCMTVQPLIVSKTNRIRLRFTTNREGRFRGFLLSYTGSITPGCGGDFTGQNGTITSPNYPMSFPAFSDCVWRIKVPADRYISLRFLEFEGINGTNSECSADSIEVRDGYSSRAQLIERYCIQNIPPVIVSRGHELYIHFRARSDAKATSHHRKFRGFYLTHSSECNETIGLEDGRVKNSQLSASSYFVLRLGKGQLFLSPWYGRVGNAYSWCSQTQVLNTIVGEYLQIDLLNLTEVTAIATQGYQLPGTSYKGFVSSYKVQYSYDRHHWITYIEGTENSSHRGYREFSGNTDYDGIKKNILKPSIVARVIRIFPTGYQSYPVKHMCLRVELYGCRHGLGCGSIVSYKKPGKISVRGSDQQSTKCTWLSIPSTPSLSNDVITFHFTYFDVPCQHGQVMLHARDGGKIETLCGADPPPVSSLPASSQIRLEIKLEKGAAVWGFDVKYKTESLGCGRIVQVSNNGTVTSPNHPLLYNNNQDCTWILSSHPGSKIRLKFIAFDLQQPNQSQCSDFVQIQDGRLDTSAVLGKFCGNSAPIPWISTTNHLRVTLHSDNTTNGKGFLLKYSLVSPREQEPPSSGHQPAQTKNTEAIIPTVGDRHSSGHSTDVTACLIHISLLTLLMHLVR